MKRFESLTEKKLREAIEAGELDNLPGKGEPVDLRENPFEDPDLRTVHRLLRNAGFAPAWIEERKDIDAEFERALTQLQRAWELYGEESTKNHDWQRNVDQFQQVIEQLNARIKVYNLKAPSTVFHRHHIDANAVVNAVKKNESNESREANDSG